MIPSWGSLKSKAAYLRTHPRIAVGERRVQNPSEPQQTSPWKRTQMSAVTMVSLKSQEVGMSSYTKVRI